MVDLIAELEKMAGEFDKRAEDDLGILRHVPKKRLLHKCARDLRSLVERVRAERAEPEVPPKDLLCLACGDRDATRYARMADGSGFAVCNRCRIDEEINPPPPTKEP